ncbi:MAG: ABC transporter ATP-binding protein [Alphaproteobacteria bacterium]|jgi:spermidine/putrescine transport system ATP-binding protein|nr:ABC transporter ATP-binding protein [Alphaproteobacteria bacterium]MDP6253380.1 ABC transporter ATP-binding protein [Alphaproteobacteria bacterium]MDP7055490.1 ABC transporter ATP-binding protein [Alphaproteobacteria bacterium]MDP7227983.1 ABC transporter ATP-binding protein [Alphaproteobacteria bacterium]MDP7461684.1 ABC transporter ATP-binding protein [Alphaproteobacteria bacterium]|tara:strand:+ start:5069 stop:6181 length:1113 start_codon:yes stop_codon:yes gene_type:complete
MAELDVVIEHVDKTFPGDTRAVIDFNAEIVHGEFVSMLGPSGCGKTTLLRMIGGLEEVTRGKIFISGQDVTDLPPSHRDTSMMFQSFALFPHRTVFQNVEFSLKMRGMDKNMRAGKVWAMLETVGLDQLASRRPSDLSGGQQQRVALARALISEPTVLLLDEPLGALDYNLRQTMMVELKKIQQETGITFIMVTHSQQEAMSMADKVIVMSDAMVQQIGSSREIHENPRNRFVADFIGNNNMFKGTIKSRSGSMIFVEAEQQLYYIRVPEHIRQVPVGQEAHFSVRADLMHTGDNPDMANKVVGSYVATEFLGTLETDVFELEPGQFVHVEQHRKLSDSTYKIGEQETLCFAADSGMLLERTRRPEDLDR